MMQHADGAVQAVVEVSNSQTEYETPSVLPDTEAPGSCNELPSSQESVVNLNQSFDEVGAALLSQNVDDTSLITVLERQPTIDGSSQTDPVTIIIGDASFLVKKVSQLIYRQSKLRTLECSARNS
jgi:hypothetical protein